MREITNKWEASYLSGKLSHSDSCECPECE